MYKDFYHMNSDPFGTLPQPDIFFDSKTHRDAWNYLVFGIESEEPFLLISGDYGMGKTMLCLKLVQKFQDLRNVLYAYIATPNLNYPSILGHTARSLNLPLKYEDETALQSLIYQHIGAQKEILPVYIIIDDAQDLDVTTLRKLQLLVNFNHNGFFPFRLVFFAHTSFLERLTIPELRALDQRIRRRYQLANFDFNDTKQYIYFRLFKAEAPGIPTFTDGAIQKIVSFSSGVPRLINNICDGCLLLGAAQELTIIDDGIVRQAIQAVGKKSIVEQIAAEELKTGSPVEAERITTQVPQQEEPGKKPADRVLPETVQSPRSSKKFITTVTLAVIVLLAVLASTMYVQYRIITADRKPAAIPHEQKETAALQNKKADTQKPPLSADTVTTVPDEKNSFVKTDTSTIPPLTREHAQTSVEPITKTTPSFDETHQAPAATTAVTETKTTAVTTSSSSTTTARSTTTVMPEPVTTYPYTLQLACYRSLAGAQEEVGVWQKKGLSPYLVRVNFKDRGWWWAIYNGYYTSQEEAQTGKDTYKLIDSLIVKTPYANLIGVYQTESALQDMLNRLKNLGYQPYAIKTAQGGMRLFVGGFATIKEAEDLNQKLSADGIAGSVENR